MKKIVIMMLGSMVLCANLAAGEEHYEHRKKSEKMTETNPLYVSECAGCHMAYQPEFLPKRSWKKMMLTLEDHFGVDATMEKEDEVKIKKYLLSNAGDVKRVGGEFAEFMRSIPSNETPLSISKIPKFVKEHREIEKRLVTQKEVRSWANCAACHTKAESGNYSERSIFIPNYGKWDD